MAKRFHAVKVKLGEIARKKGLRLKNAHYEGKSVFPLSAENSKNTHCQKRAEKEKAEVKLCPSRIKLCTKSIEPPSSRTLFLRWKTTGKFVFKSGKKIFVSYHFYPRARAHTLSPQREQRLPLAHKTARHRVFLNCIVSLNTFNHPPLSTFGNNVVISNKNKT